MSQPAAPALAVAARAAPAAPLSLSPRSRMTQHRRRVLHERFTTRTHVSFNDRGSHLRNANEIRTVATALADPACTVQVLNLDENELGPAGMQLLITTGGTTTNTNEEQQNDDDDDNNNNNNVVVLPMLVNQPPAPPGGLAVNTSVEILYLAHNNLGDQGIQILAQALTVGREDNNNNNNNHENHDETTTTTTSTRSISSRLRKLDVQYNQIGPTVGAQALAQLISGLSSLQSLECDGNQLGDDGAIRLAAALGGRHNHTLTSLSVSYNDIGDVGAQALIRALRDYRNGTLTSCNVQANPISTACRTQLQILLQRNQTLQWAVTFCHSSSTRPPPNLSQILRQLQFLARTACHEDCPNHRRHQHHQNESPSCADCCSSCMDMSFSAIYVIVRNAFLPHFITNHVSTILM